MYRMTRYQPLLTLCLSGALLLGGNAVAEAQPAAPHSSGQTAITYTHPWQGKKVAFFGDSITDPNLKGGQIKNYWSFLQDWIGITPYVYAISGRQWNDIPRQTTQLKQEHGDDVDGILILMGTNDYNKGLPLGEWFDEQMEEVEYANDGRPKRTGPRRHRTLSLTDTTYRGRINLALRQLKQTYPTKQIILMTPLHRGRAYFNDSNVQPDENYQNTCGAYIDAYIEAVKEAGNLWAMPVIDLNAVSGLQPMVQEQLDYFWDKENDRLHPNTQGQQRMGRAILQQLLLYPVME